MSVQAIAAVFERSRSKNSQRLLLLAIADHADANMTAWPSVETIRKKMNFQSKRNIHRLLRELEELGELVRVGITKRGVAKYRISLPATPICSSTPFDAQPLSEQAPASPSLPVSPSSSPLLDRAGVPLFSQASEPSYNHQRTIKDANAVETDPNKLLFGNCRLYLEGHGLSTDKARSLLGKWKQDLADDTPILVGLVEQAKSTGVADPVAWITAAVQTRNGKRRSNGSAQRRQQPTEVL
jgi:hypothetical protein